MSAAKQIRVSAQVMAHPSRSEQIPGLLAALDRPVEVTWDRYNDKHDTGTRAMLAFDPDATHHLVIQDDAVVCRDLLAGVERMLADVPRGTPVSLYLGRVRPFPKAIDAAVAACAERAASFLVMPELNWGVAVVMPTELIGPLFEWYPSGNQRGYDSRMGAWLLSRGLRTWYSWPSLVDHADTESLIGHGSGRHAHTFIGERASALDVDWSARVLMVNTTRVAAGPTRSRRRMPR